MEIKNAIDVVIEKFFNETLEYYVFREILRDISMGNKTIVDEAMDAVKKAFDRDEATLGLFIEIVRDVANSH